MLIRTLHRGRRALPILLTFALTTMALGQTATHPAETSAAPEPAAFEVRVSERTTSVSSDDSFSISASVTVKQPTPYLEVRLQLRYPGGRLIFQRTEARTDVETGTVDVTFERTLEDWSLRPGAYPYEIRVRTEVGEPREYTYEGTLLVHPPDPTPAPVALVVRVTSPPPFDPEGRFIDDPSDDGVREAIASLSAAILADPELRLSLILPPMILDGWARASTGYHLAGPGGVTEVSADSPVARSYRTTLDDLKAALETGRLELLNTPYADPDIAGLSALHSLHDLGVHYARGISSYLTTLELEPSTGSAFADDLITPAALSVIAKHGVRHILLEPGALHAEGAPVAPGAWSISQTDLVALALDRELGAHLAAAQPTDAVDHVFARSVSEEATAPIAAICRIGPGIGTDVSAVLDAARALARAPWATLALVSEAAAAEPSGYASVQPLADASDAPPGYWDEALAARRWARALETAAGANDPDAQAVSTASLIAQSQSWAGPDGKWSLADRGRSFSSAASRHARSFLDLVSVTVADVTLAGPRGTLPVSIVNASGKALSVTLSAGGDGVHFPGGTTNRITLQPQENFHTIPVDLQSLLSSEITIALWSSEVQLASETATVRASYLDRLALIGGVAVVLLGLLYFIRKRLRSSAFAQEIPEESA